MRRAVAGDAAAIASCQGACCQEAYGHLVVPGFFDGTTEGIGADRWAGLIEIPGVDVAVLTA